MPETIAADSVGLVESQMAHFDAPLPLQCGKTLEVYDIACEKYGEQNAQKSNALLISYQVQPDFSEPYGAMLPACGDIICKCCHTLLKSPVNSCQA
jgi:hypothetical protein